MIVERIVPWENPGWDLYVRNHPGGTVYHTSAWVKIVCGIGRYEPLCLAAREDGAIRGIFPLAGISSPLTGRRLVSLPFSDTCCAIAGDQEAALSLIEAARELLAEKSFSFLEMRGAPRAADGSSVRPDELGFSEVEHYTGYVIPLSADTEAIRRSFHRTSVRQTINKSFRLGVTVRRGEGRGDLERFYRLYLLNRRRHGIPPQPISLFQAIMEGMADEPGASLYIAEHDGEPIAALIVLRYKRIAYAKYEGVDERFRNLLPVYALLWKTVEDAALSGDEAYDFGRTAADNPGLNAFKSRWGTRAVELPYYFHPPREGLSVVSSSSWKYRLFTATVRRMPLGVNRWLGGKIFRHFG